MVYMPYLTDWKVVRKGVKVVLSYLSVQCIPDLANFIQSEPYSPNSEEVGSANKVMRQKLRPHLFIFILHFQL